MIFSDHYIAFFDVLGCKPFFNRDEESEIEFVKNLKGMANENEYRCAILADDIYVGNIYLTDITRESAHYHFFIGNKDYWGKGVAKKASGLILDYAFNALNLKKVCLRVKK